MPFSPSRRWLERLAIPALLALALATRLWTLGWGLPYVEHPDEPHYVEVVVDMVQRGDPNPNFFRHPPLVFYLLTIVARAYAWWAVRAGELASLADLPSKTYTYTTVPGLYVWSRALIAVLGAATVGLLFVLGRRMFGLRAALLAAVFLAVARFHVEHSYYIATSGPTSLAAVLLLLGMWEVARAGAWRGYLVAGAATGLAAAVKYNAAAISLGLGVAALLYAWGRWGELLRVHLPRLIAAAALSIVVFLIVNPFALLDFDHFYADVTGQSGFYELGGGNFEGPWNVGGYAGFFWSSGLGWFGSLALLGGLPLLLRRWPRQTALLLAVAAIELLLLLPYVTNFLRNLLIIYPAVVLLAAAGAAALADGLGGLLARRAGGVEGPQLIDVRPDAPPSPLERRRFALAARWSAAALAALAAVMLAPQARDTFWLLRYWGQPHTLVRAAEELRAQPRGMLAAVESNPVQWAGDPVVEPVRWLGTYPPDWYRERGYRFLIVNSENYAPQDQAAYERLFAGASVLLALPSRDLGLMPGPGGALLDLGEYPDMIPFVRRPARFGGQIELLGYEMRPGDPRPRVSPLEGADERALAPGQPLQINLYWRALAPPAADYTLFLHLYDAAGQRVAQRDLPPRSDDYPPSRWRPGELVIDRADMPLPALPPGEYRFDIGLYDTATGAALPADSGAPITLATISVR